MPPSVFRPHFHPHFDAIKNARYTKIMSENILPFQTKVRSEAYEYLKAKSIVVSCHRSKQLGVMFGAPDFEVYPGWCFHFTDTEKGVMQAEFIPDVCLQRNIMLDRMYVNAADGFKDYE